MTKISLRGTMLVAVSALALAACTSDSSNTDALNAANATIATKSATIAERDATIASKTATIAEKDVTIAAKQASIDAANASIATLTTDKVNLLSTLVERNQTIGDLEADIVDLQAEIAAANADIAALETDIADLEAMVDVGDADIVALQAEIAAAEAEIVALTAENAGLDGDLAAANATIASKQATIDAANLTIAQKQAALDSANATIATHLVTIAARDASIVTKNADIAAKASTISGLQADVAGLEADVASLEADVASLEADVASLEADKATLVADKATLEGEKAVLEDDKAVLQSQVTDYNKTAFNANRDNTSYENGGYQRNVGDAALQPERDAIAAAQADVDAKQTALTDASAAYDTALDAAINADTAFTDARDFNLSAYEGQTLAAFFAGSPSGAAYYADVMGLDITDTADLTTVVSRTNYDDVGVDGLWTALVAANAVANAAFDAKNSALLDLNAAQDDVTDANTALAIATGNKKGTAEAVRGAEDYLSSAQSDLATRQSDEATASTAVDDAQAAFDEANGFTVDPAYDGQSIATYFADLQSDAEFYAEIMGLDLTDSAIQGLLVDATAYAAAVSDLQTALTDAQNALTSAQNDVTSAEASVTNAETALATAIQNYHTARRPQFSSEMTLYQADGRAVSASGAMVYKQSLEDNLSQTQALEEAGRLTALFLVDGNGDPTNVLVFQASMLGATSETNPFMLPAGAATFESSSMVAAFAQLEGSEDGFNTYTVGGDINAGSLTLNFNDNTGRLVVVGLNNSGSSTEDFSVNAELTFDPESGTFSAASISQAYTSNETGLGEVATGNITGALNAVADAFTAYIDTTDVTGINDLDVMIMTRIVGAGAVASAPVAP